MFDIIDARCNHEVMSRSPYDGVMRLAFSQHTLCAVKKRKQQSTRVNEKRQMARLEKS